MVHWSSPVWPSTAYLPATSSNSFVLGLYNAAGPGQPLGDDLVERAKSIHGPAEHP